MTRTVICIFKGGGQSSFQIQLHKALGDLPREAYPLNNLLNDPVFDQIKKGTLKANTLKQAGRLLFRELTTHSALRDAMKLVLATPVGNCTPIYVNMMCGEMDALPWEILYHRDGSFLALDKRWPIGRIADSTVNIPLYPRTFEFPLRVMVFLAAAKVDASFEWRALWEAITNAPIPLSLHVLVCQDSLKEEIDRLASPNIKVDFVPANFSDLEYTILNFNPHILHFFCHGSIDNGPYLQLATRIDWETQRATGTLAIDGTQLQQIPDIGQNIWLVTLNCCEGGASLKNASALARSLVAEGFPAVVGMRETIASNDAHIFCKTFYRILLNEIHYGAFTGDDHIEVEWSKALIEARRRLCEYHNPGKPLTSAAAGTKQWALPIIYVRPEPFILKRSLKNETAIQIYRQFRETLRAQIDTPSILLAEIEAKIIELEAEADK